MTNIKGGRSPPEFFRHRILGLLRVERVDGWIYIYHRTGKLLNRHKEKTTMPRLNSDLSNTQQSLIAKDVYTARIETATPKKSKPPANNPYLEVNWFIEGDREGNIIEGVSGRKVNFDNIMTGGTTKKGDVMPLFQLAKLLERGQIAWTCLTCHPEANDLNYDGAHDRVCEFVRGTGENGLPKGSINCPDCKQPFKASYNTDDFIGKRFRVAVDVEQGTEGRPDKNVIKDYLAVG
jgi:hypothetical protein